MREHWASFVIAAAITVTIIMVFLTSDAGEIAPMGVPTMALRIPTPVIPTPRPVLNLTVDAIVELYDGNEVAADERFAGRRANIRGPISDIREAGDYYDVRLDASGFSLTDIVCKVDKARRSSILPLRKGDYVTVTGTIRGQSIVDVNVDDCRIR